MRKKALLSLIVAPAALTGFANVDLSDQIPSYTKDNWPASGVVGEGYNLDFTNGLGTLPYPGLSVKATVANLPAGKYQISFSSLENAVVNVNDAEVIASGETSGEFTLAEEGDITIQIVNATSTGTLTFGVGTLEIVCDFEAIQTAAQAALDAKSTLTELTEGADADGAIQAKIDAYNQKVAGIQTRVTALSPSAGKESDLKLYKDEVLVNGYEGSNLKTDIDALSFDTLEAEIKAENDRYAVEQTNEAARTAAENALKAYQDEYAADKAKVDAVDAEGKKVLSEYVQGKVEAPFAAWTTAIKAAEDALAAAFTEEAIKSGEAIEYTLDSDGLDAADDAFDDALANAQADEAAYAEWKAKLDELNKTNDEVRTKVQSELSGIYAPDQAAALDKFQEIYNAAIEDSEIEEGTKDGAAETSEADIAILEQAIADLKAAQDAALSAKDANDDAYKALTGEGGIAPGLDADDAELDKAIAALQTKIAGIGDTEITAGTADAITAIKDKDAAIHDAIAKYKEDAQKAYEALDAASFDAADEETGVRPESAAITAQIEAATADVEALSDRLDIFIANKELVDAAQTALDEMKAAVEEKALAAELTLINVPAKLKTTYEILQGSIDTKAADSKAEFLSEKANNELTEYTEANFKEINGGITTTKENADKIIEGFTKAEKAVKDWKAESKSFDTAIETKVTITGYEADKAASKEDEKTKVNADDTILSIAEIDAEIKAVEDAVIAAAAKNEDALYVAITGVYDEQIDGSDLSERIAAERSAWLTNVSEDNYSTAKAALDEVETALNKYAATEEAAAKPGYDAAKVKYDEFAAVLQGARDVLDAIPATLAAEDEATLDEKVDKALDPAVVTDGVKAVNDLIKAIADNEEAHDALVKDADAVKTLFQETKDFNDATAVEPAKAYFVTVIADKETAFNDVLAKVEASYQAVTSAADKTEQAKLIADTNTDLVKLQQTIKQNEVNHNLLLDKSDATLATINGIVETLDGYVLSSEDKASAEKAIETLTALNKEVTDSYAKGELGDDEDGVVTIGADKTYEDFDARYDAIVADVNGVLAKYLSEYENAVKEANDATLNEIGWYTSLKELKDAYTKGIQDINELQTVDNAGYKAYITENGGYPSHEKLYGYATEYYKLQKEVAALLLESYTKGADKAYLFEDEDGNTIESVQSKLDELKADIDAVSLDVEEIVGKYNALAEAYYQQEYARASQVVSDAKTKMANLSEDIVTKYTKAEDQILARAQRAHVAESEGDGLHRALGIDTASGANDCIADNLDKIQSIDVDAAAAEQWALDAKEYQAKLEAIVADYDALVKNGYVPADDKTAFETAKDTAKEALGTVNDEATSADDLLESIVNYRQADQDAIDALQAAYDSAKAASDNNKANQDKAAEYATLLADYQSQIDAVKAYVSDLNVGEEVQWSIDEAQAKLDRVQGIIDANSGNLVDESTQSAINYWLPSIPEDIESAYYAAYDTAFDNIAAQAESLKTYFNDNAASFEESSLDEEAIKAYKEKIEEHLAYKDENYDRNLDADEINTDAVHDALLAEETAINDLYQELAKNLEQDPVGDAQAGYKAQISDAADAVQALQDKIDAEDSCLSEEEKAELQEEITALQDALDAASAQIDSLGNNILTQGDKVQAAIDAVTAGVETETPKVDAAIATAQATKAAHDASDARYEELLAQLEELKAEYQAVQDLDDEYDYNLRSTEELQFALEDAEYYLEQDKAAYALTAESQLERIDDIRSLIDGYVSYLNQQEAYLQINNDLTALADAQTAVYGDNVADQDALIEELNALIVRHNDNVAAYGAINSDTEGEGWLDTDAAKEVIEEAKAITEASEALSAKVAENVYVVGDLDESGDISISDYAILVGEVVGGAYQTDKTDKGSLAADINGDGYINAQDIVRLVKMLQGETASRARLAAAAARQSDSNMISADLVQDETGATRIAINLTNAANFVAGQFDLKLPAGMSIVSEKLTSRANGLQLVSSDNADGMHRIVISAPELHTIASGEGAIVYIEVTGTGTVTVEKAIFADSNAIGYEIQSHTSGIGSMIYDSIKSGAQKIYDASGRLMNRIQRGFNIIRNSDGTTTKQYNKGDK